MKQTTDVSISDYWINEDGHLEVEITVDIDGRTLLCTKEITSLK